MNGQYKPGDIVLNHWKLERVIGEGSYGTVYEAVREDFDGTFYSSAIKIVTTPQSADEVKNIRSEGMDDRSVTDYFRRVVDEVIKEVRWMSNLMGNSNIVSYADHAVIEHQNDIGWDIIIRMELLTPLMDFVQTKRLTPNGVIRLGIDICKALELCQTHNIIHRDIKLENIFWSESGNFKLGDFGIARTVKKTTSELSRKGTDIYMAPEVYREEPYDSSVDIYSLGIVMYRLLNENRAPFLPPYPETFTFSDRERSLARRMSGEKLPPPKNANARLTEIVLKACAYHPRDRYSNPAQMRRELEALYDPNEAESPDPTDSVWKESLIVRNLDSQTGEALPSAEFRITTAEGFEVNPNGVSGVHTNTPYAQNGHFTTDGQGEIRISNLKPGSYVLAVVNPPAGYVTDAPFTNVIIGDKGGTKTVVVTNTRIQKGSLIIQTRDSRTGEILPGAQFRVTTAAGFAVGPNGMIGIPTNTPYAQPGIFTTDNQGWIRIDNLNPGPYVLTEVKAPEGYVVDTPYINVAVGTNGGVQNIVITNTRVQKKDRKRKVIGIIAACAAVVICVAAFCVFVLPQLDIFPSASSQPSSALDPTPTPSNDPADPTPTPSADPAPPTAPQNSPEPSPAETPWTCPFPDVSEKDWFYPAVKFAAERGMIQGTGSGKFNPHGIATRGVFVTLLYRFAGSPATEGSYFDDVEDGQYYTDAVTWAAANSYVSGSGNNLFRPDSQITHQEVIVILWDYAGKPDADATVLTSFPDADKVSSWAVSAMAWAVDVGIIAQADSRLNPKGDTTRAEAVTYIMRLYEAM